MPADQDALISRQANLQTIETYINACNAPDKRLLQSVLADDVVHFFMGREPLRGADSLVNWILRINGEKTIAWTVENVIADADQAAIEFTEVDRSHDASSPQIGRGTERYQFRNGKITEVRAYYHVVSGYPVSELVGFPYAQRGFVSLARS